MTSSEQSFLCELIQQKQPKKLLELGVAAGSSSVIILNSIKDIQGSHLTSVDYLTLWYRDESKSTGFVVDNYPELKKKVDTIHWCSGFRFYGENRRRYRFLFY